MIGGGSEVRRNSDVHHRFRQPSDLLYLTGFPEPEALAVFTPGKDKVFTLFLRPRDKERETWTGRRAGIATWNRARDVVFHRLAEQVNPDAAGQLQADIHRLSGLLGQLNGSRAAIAETANHAAGIADQIAHQLASHAYNNAFALRVMRGIASDGGAISAQGERTAEQAAMTLDSLYTAYRLGGKTTHQGEIRPVIQGLFDQVNNPSAYSAPNFAAQMQKLDALLAQER